MVLHVHEREEANQTDFQANRDRLRSEIISERQNQFFTAYMENAKSKLTINIDLAAFALAVA